MAKKISLGLVYLLVAVLVCLPLFLFLGYLPIRLYDESRLAFNAMEMAESGNWLVTTFEHQPDLWGTKPPLMIWLQAVSIKFLGLTEWAIRLPAALAATATCLVLFLFSRRMLHTNAIGALAALVLVGIQGYVTIHGARTGDYDVLLVLFVALASLAWFAWTENGEKRNLCIFFAALALAALTKGVAALLFLPGVGLYTIFRGKLLALLKTPAFYMGAVFFVLVIGGYYWLREQALPGYWQAIYENELGGRFFKTVEEHRHGFGYYFEAMVRHKFTFGVPVVLLSLVLIKWVSNPLHRRLIAYLALVSVLFLLVISTSKTKLEWYDMPVYPLLALRVAVFVYDVVYLRLGEYAAARGKYWRWGLMLCISVYLAVPYVKVLEGIVARKEHGYEQAMYAATYYLRDAIRQGDVPENTVWVNTEYAAHTEFYLTVARQRGIPIPKKYLPQVVPGDRVITNGPHIMPKLDSTYTITRILEQDGLAVFEVGR